MKYYFKKDTSVCDNLMSAMSGRRSFSNAWPTSIVSYLMK